MSTSGAAHELAEALFARHQRAPSMLRHSERPNNNLVRCKALILRKTLGRDVETAMARSGGLGDERIMRKA